MVLRKKLLYILAAVIGMLPLTACWDHVEISDMLVVAGIGLDFDDAGGAYSATVEFVSVEAEGDKNITAKIVEGEGNTAYNAIQDAMLTAGGRMFGNHCKAIVVGESFAKKGINEVVEIVLRSPDFRKTLDLMVAEGMTAREIFSKKTVNNDIISYELSKVLKDNEKAVRNTASTGTYSLHDTLLSGDSFNVLPTVKVRKNQDEDVLIVDGCAILSQARLQGYLNGRQSKLFNLLTRDGSGILLTVDGDGHPLDIKLTDVRVSLHPRIHDGEPAMDIRIEAKATLEPAVALGHSLATKESRTQMGSKISGRLSMEMHDFISEIQSLYAADIFDFYVEFKDWHRPEWNDLRADWGAHFQNMRVSVYSDVRVTDSGLIQDYMPDGQDGANALP